MPLALIAVFPGDLDVVALYFLIVRFAHMLLVTRVCSWLDRWDRLNAVRVGIATQTAGVLLAVSGISLLSRAHDASAYALVVLAGLIASLGSTMMDVTVAQDWIPSLVPTDRLARVNSRLRQVDLVTELAAPVLAGLLLSVRTTTLPLLGFLGIAVWNIVSFLPEYRLLASVFAKESGLADKPRGKVASKPTLIESLANGWRDFLAQPAAASIGAYALLCLTVLSPHGVLLSAWLKIEWGLSEAAIGLFRGLGAVFGLLATVAFPMVLSRVGLVRAARLFIVWEALCLVAAGAAYYHGPDLVLVFAAGVLLSRIGLYGFSLGDTEIRQRTIPSVARGRVNGFASALASLATLGVYGAGTLLKDPEDFGLLVYGSIGCVATGACIFSAWSLRKPIPMLDTRKEAS